MQTTFAEDKAQMGLELAEIERILELKTQLVNTLTDQLDEAARRSRAEDEQHQRERDVFMARFEKAKIMALGYFLHLNSLFITISQFFSGIEFLLGF